MSRLMQDFVARNNNEDLTDYETHVLHVAIRGVGPSEFRLMSYVAHAAQKPHREASNLFSSLMLLL